eukprot:m.11643 g.11643  ORF g.11643 m.11643 type:complete len:324 (+) comp4497_c0_seq2:128-1099(+)
MLRIIIRSSCSNPILGMRYLTANQQVTARSMVQKLFARFKFADIPEAKLSALHIVAGAIGVRNFTGVEYDESILSQSDLEQIEQFANRRMKREPVQLILGEWDFHHIFLRLKAGVFCPRPETEELVEHCLTCLEGDVELDGNESKAVLGIENPRVLDIGSGTGCIGLAIANCREDVHCDAVDINPKAVALANENAKLNKLQNRYLCELGDCGHLEKKQGYYDLIVSNPPYIPDDMRTTMAPEVLLYDPENALFSGADGLDCIRKIMQQSRELLCWQGVLILEFDSPQAHILTTLAHEHKYADARLIRDMEGSVRFLQLSRGSA